MRRRDGAGRAKDLLAACFVLFTALLVWPLLSIANQPRLIAGVPALVLYLFGVWAVIVAVLVWAARRPDGEDGP
jgi:apolipoprotein N-acyltransferase